MMRLFFLFAISFIQPDYSKIFQEDYSNAQHYLVENSILINKTASKYGISKDILCAIFFPELIRYSSFSDFLETSALEIIYTVKGKNYADFSIGRLQIKPSFVEKIESVIQESELLKQKYKAIISFETDYEPDRRKIRIKRLKAFEWQLSYVCAFYDYFMMKNYMLLGNLNRRESIKMIATAYNSGFDRDWNYLMKMSSIAAFPYGTKVSSNIQYNYGDISAFYLINKKN